MDLHVLLVVRLLSSMGLIEYMAPVVLHERAGGIVRRKDGSEMEGKTLDRYRCRIRYCEKRASCSHRRTQRAGKELSCPRGGRVQHRERQSDYLLSLTLKSHHQKNHPASQWDEWSKNYNFPYSLSGFHFWLDTSQLLVTEGTDTPILLNLPVHPVFQCIRFLH